MTKFNIDPNGKLRPIHTKHGIPQFYEMVGMECPICHKKGWCLLSAKQDTVVCMRTPEKGRKILFNGYVYSLDENKRTSYNLSKLVSPVSEEQQPDNIQHKVYSLVIKTLGLNKSDENHLIKVRGLNRKQIRLRGYCSTDRSSLMKQIDGQGTIWEELFKSNGLPKNAWNGVAGFFYDEEHHCPVFQVKSGIAIPCRNQYGQIVGMQIRVNPSDMSYFAKYSDKRLEGKNGKLITSVHFDNTTGKLLYRVRLASSPENIIAEGVCKAGEKIICHYKGVKFDFKIATSPKYLFATSIGKKHGTIARSLPHFAFSDSVLSKAEFDAEGNGKVDLFKLIDRKSVIITEGLLKGDIIASYLEKTDLSNLGSQLVVAVAGVNVWNKAYYVLDKLKVERIFSAFDQDFETNNSVFDQMERMIDKFIAHKFQTYLLTWSIGKGLDDCILNNGLSTVVVNQY